MQGLNIFRFVLPEDTTFKLLLAVFFQCFITAYENSFSGEDYEKIKKLQSSALRFIFPCVSMIKKIWDLSSCRKYNPDGCYMQDTDLLFDKLVLTLREPHYLAEALLSRGEVCQCGNLNDAQLHYFWKVKLEIGWKGFAYYCPKLFNNLPILIKCNKAIALRLVWLWNVFNLLYLTNLVLFIVDLSLIDLNTNNYICMYINDILYSVKKYSSFESLANNREVIYLYLF